MEARGFYDTGRFDMAFKRCEQILNIDPYNIAARKLQEEVNKKRENYAIEGYNQMRSFALWRVTKGWDLPVRRFGDKTGGIIVQEGQGPNLTQRLQIKLALIVIPKLEFRDATIREAIDFLKQKSVQLDVSEPDQSKKGVNIVLKLGEGGGGGGAPVEAVPAPPAGGIPGLDANAAPAPGVAAVPLGNPGDARITVALSNIPLGEALRYVTNLAGLKFKVEQYAVSVVPLSTPIDTLITKEWKVPPSFLSGSPSVGGGAGSPRSPGRWKRRGSAGDAGTRGGSGITQASRSA